LDAQVCALGTPFSGEFLPELHPDAILTGIGMHLTGIGRMTFRLPLIHNLSFVRFSVESA
jgi:hypothetical protein